MRRWASAIWLSGAVLPIMRESKSRRFSMGGIGSILKRSITLFWLILMLICFVMVFFRFARSDPTCRFASLPWRLGAAAALADCSFSVDLGAISCVLNNSWASRTLALGSFCGLLAVLLAKSEVVVLWVRVSELRLLSEPWAGLTLNPWRSKAQVILSRSCIGH